MNLLEGWKGGEGRVGERGGEGKEGGWGERVGRGRGGEREGRGGFFIIRPYVVDLVPCFAIRTNPCVFSSVCLCKPCVCYCQCF